MWEHAYWAYILASGRNGTLYVGVTNDLYRRVYEHREGLLPGFTRRYGVKRLVYFEEYGDINEAILREKRIKRWHRKWKLELIEARNPQWKDLWLELADSRGGAIWAPGSRLARSALGRDDKGARGPGSRLSGRGPRPE
jgi:putative endonuclease